MPAHLLKTARLTFIAHQEREVTRGLRIDSLTILYDVATENTSLAVFVRLVFHIKHLLSDLPDDLHRQAIFSYALSSETKKSPKLQDNGLVSFLGQGR